MIRAIILFFLFFSTAFYPLLSYPAPPVEEIQALLEKPEILCGRFEQQKRLVGIRAPVVSEGRFCVHDKKGVLWQTLKPFPNTLRVTKDDITMMQGNNVTKKLEAKHEPMVRVINHVLFSLISGNLEPLQQFFDIDAKIRDQAWNVLLKTRDRNLAGVINEIRLQGNKFVRQIDIQETGGDSTRLVFLDIRTGGQAMNADEARQYE